MAKKNQDQALKNVLTQMIVDVFERNHNKPLNYKQVSGHLNINDAESRDVIQNILFTESKKGLFKETEKGKFKLKEVRALMIGKVDMTADGSAFVILEDSDDDDVYIGPRKLRRALHGDLVKIHVHEKKRGSRRKDGEVVEIIERARTEFTGIIHLSEQFAFVVADDRKMLHDIFIPLSGLHGAKNGQKVVVSITEWPEDSKNPAGEVKYVLGNQGDNNAEMNAILADYGFPLSFPKEVEDQATKLEDHISQEEIAKRRDFRSITTFTIDPEDAKDFDDAISFQLLDTGHYEIGIHIADVSHFVQPDSILDQEAYLRGTSVYLVDRVIPMLPEKLSNDLCSLKPEIDRLTFSAVFEMNKEAQIISEWFGKGIIHSDKRFSYEDAQEILDQQEGTFYEELSQLNHLASILRDRKFKNGAINFETQEVRFKLDEAGKPLGVYVKERKDTHKLIEDFMLLANRRVAEFIGKQNKGKFKKTFVYRSHEAPNPDNIQSFAQFAARFGYKLSFKTERETARSLNSIMSRIEGSREQNVLTSLAIRSMAKAIYTTKSMSHYGLAFDYYTHFTSPIRRYPDVMVHRLLDFYLKGGQQANADSYEKMCEHSSQMEKKAADAERASVKYKQAEFLEEHIGELYTGIISGVTEWGIYVELEENKCEGMIRLRDITDDFYSLDEKNFAIIGQRKKQVYQLGDTVKIKVKKVDLTKRQIDFTLISKL